MNKKAISIIISFIFLFSVLINSGTKKVQAKPFSDEIIQNDMKYYTDTMDIGESLRKQYTDDAQRQVIQKQIEDEVIKAKEQGLFAEEPSDGDEQGGNISYIGMKRQYVSNDAAYGGYYLKTYTLMKVGEKCELWLADNLSYPDSRLTPVVTQEEIDRVVADFDNNIYQKDTEFFGTPESRTGENSLIAPPDYYQILDNTERVIILADNIRDEKFYDSSYPFFAAGFFSQAVSVNTDRNIITLNVRYWDTRLEEVYLPTTAHEFQHLIHFDNDPAETTWLNEGMSDFAEFLCGYGQPWGHINYYLSHPENSLVDWDEYYESPTGPETLADYGQAYLLQLYIYEHFGLDFVQALAKDTAHGIDSVNKLLRYYHSINPYKYNCIDFKELFRRFSIATAIDSKMPGTDIYSFNTIDINVNYDSAKFYEKTGVPAWGPDFEKIDGLKNIKSITMLGDKYFPAQWSITEDPLNEENMVAFGGVGDEKDNKIIISADLTGKSSATLNFKNLYDIEDGWDYGIVKVSTDGGFNWTSLSNDNTSTYLDEGAYESIKESVPGFTGYIDGWRNESFDLSQFAGGKILICFDYMTDWAINYEGWFIDDISIPEIGYYNNCSNIESFLSYDALMNRYVNYKVSFIYEKKGINGAPSSYYVESNSVSFKFRNNLTFTNLKRTYDNLYMVVWCEAPDGVTYPANFDYIVNYNSINK